MLMLRPLLLGLALSLCSISAAQADDEMSRPFGISSGDYDTPFYAPSRDNSGVRLVVNGRAVDLQERSSYTSPQPMRTGVSHGPTLRGPTLSASAIGNAINVSNTSNSTIFIHSFNAGNQYAVARAGGSAR